MMSVLLGQLGSGARSAIAVVFPTLAVFEDQAPELGILLYLLETGASSTLLFVRTSARLVALGRSPATRAASREVSQMRHARELMGLMMLVGAVFTPLLTMAIFAMRGGEWHPQWDVLAGRGRWLLLMVAASGLLDVLGAPMRSSLWLQSAVAQQMSRLFLVLPVVMAGGVIYSVTASTVGMVAPFVLGRLAMDLSEWRAANRQARRRRWFGRLADLEPGTSEAVS